jgi:hypothetical protein
MSDSGRSASAPHATVPNGHSGRRSTLTWGLLAFAILGGFAIPLLMGAGAEPDDTSDADRLAGNRRRIEAMTELERRRLRAWFDKFRELDESERDRYRRMHDTFSADENLDRTLETYRDWLETLTVIQRDALRNESDPDARLALVREYREKQAADDLKRQDWWRRSGPATGRGGWPGSRHEPEEFEGVYTLLEQHLDLDAETKRKLDATTIPLLRHVVLLRESFARTQPTERPPTERPMGEVRLRWPPSELLGPIVAALPADLQEELEGTKTDDGRRSRIAVALHGAIWQEYFSEWKRSNPTDERLLAVYASQSPAAREELMRASHDEFRRELQKLLLYSTHPEFAEVRPVSDLLRTQMRYGSPSFGPGRPGERRPGDDPRGQGRPGSTR